ncbi:MAG: DUF5694 domain-containing protein [Bacteroidota bacterium]
MKSLRLTLLFAIFLTSVYSQSQKTEVLVLGTSHFSNIEGFESSMLNTVISKLDSFDFEVIGIEKMSGELLNDIRSRNDNAFDGITKGGFGKLYLELADTVQISQNITYPEAELHIRNLLQKQTLSPSETKELIMNFLAITDLPSAALQYSTLEDKSIFSSSFEKYVSGILERSQTSKNEHYSLALKLAILENIERLEPIDNFQDESLLFKYYPSFIDDFQANAEVFSTVNELPIFQKTSDLTKSSIENSDFYKLYSFMNSEEYKTGDLNAQWKIWLESNFESGSNKGRYYLWEMRNLSITANILNLIAQNPGKRLLIIIGASHTGFIEKYLKSVENIEVLQFD